MRLLGHPAHSDQPNDRQADHIIHLLGIVVLAMTGVSECLIPCCRCPVYDHHHQGQL